MFPIVTVFAKLPQFTYIIEVLQCLISKAESIYIRVRNLPCDNVHGCTIWVRGILQWVNANIKCVAQALAVNLVCLDSILGFFLMTSVLAILFSVVQRSSTLCYLTTEGNANGPLHHLMVVCGHPYSFGRPMPQMHVCCFYEHVLPR